MNCWLVTLKVANITFSQSIFKIFNLCVDDITPLSLLSLVIINLFFEHILKYTHVKSKLNKFFLKQFPGTYLTPFQVCSKKKLKKCKLQLVIFFLQVFECGMLISLLTYGSC